MFVSVSLKLPLQIALTQVELTGTNGSFKNIKLVWLTAFRLVQMAGTGACHYTGSGACHYTGTGACHYAGTGVGTTPVRGLGKYNRSVKQRSRQAAVVSSKSESPNLLPPAYDHPWRTYGKKINGTPVLNTLSTE